MRILVSIAVVTALLSGQAPAPKGPTPGPGSKKPPPEEAAPGFQSINAEDCKKWLSVLACDEFEGRETATPGYQKAADMVAAHFKEIGLLPVGDKDSEGRPTYFQNVPFVAAGINPETARFEVTVPKDPNEVTGPKDPITLKPGEGFGATGSGNVSAHGPLAFVVVKSRQPKLPEFDVKGKIVIALSYDAEGNLVPLSSSAIADIKKTGPAALVRINDVVAARGMSPGDAIRKDQSENRPAGNPAKGATVAISKAVAESLAQASGRDLASMIAKAKSTGDSQSVATKLTATIELASKVVDIPVPNVVGFLEGSDPVLKNELVIIGSHLDHLGRTASGEIYNGADDDGSGSTGVLAVSRAFTKNPRHPKRSVLFLTFCGEEKGLLGSEWYVEHPIFPHASVMAELQMDMIGRCEEAVVGENPGTETAEDNLNTLHLIGARKIAPSLNDLIEKVNADHTGFVFEYDQEGVYYRSDHYNFAKKGIPIAFFFTGFHRDYHKPTDDVEKIDFPKLARVAQLVYLTGWELAERPQRLPVEKGKKPKDEK
jgi:Zn-dependent M28 family amino/carboxypeptidase